LGIPDEIRGVERVLVMNVVEVLSAAEDSEVSMVLV
jgi:hypothetical protein